MPSKLIQSAIDPTITWLQETYQVLVGRSFLGCYEGAHTMSQTENPRDVRIEHDSLDVTLAGILSDVLQAYGSTAWNGITGPEGSVLYIQYWLWVKPALRSVLTIGTDYTFRIDHQVPF